MRAMLRFSLLAAALTGAATVATIAVAADPVSALKGHDAGAPGVGQSGGRVTGRFTVPQRRGS